ncbi:thermonuclease family protein [Flavimaricola marinus]|uniref:Succinoglycan biosynthesis protein ExoI n=1 Tax=Flavimaricola marinus TaxID=1819565 RepID=A0A238LBJ5_9RHOB|nr:thermonuclease family protein [Flavimaricola marinus]SMY06981.1 Succinoglycan biosynthesis protein ExoI [Flavimaricola marinus]
MTTDNGRNYRLLKFTILVFSMSLLLGLSFADPIDAQSDASEIRGTAEVIDADILSFGNQRVILWGIDAPERPQTCQLNGEFWGCYDVAFRKLQLLAGRGEVVCRFQGEPDKLGRQYGVCESGGEDLNAEMVRAGLALAFIEQSDDYMPQMSEAISVGAGLWQPDVTFEEPWIFRRRESRSDLR